MHTLSFITWDINPNIIESPIMIRYYGVLFGLAFLLGFNLMQKMFQRENISEEWLDKILMYALVGTIVGARLGHVFFYDWGYYSQHLLEIPQIWKGGLASHGAAIAIVIAMWLYTKRVTKGTKTLLWTLDKVVITVALAAALIRVGNLMNSEIIGHKSEANNAFFFAYSAKQSISSFFPTTPDNIEIDSPHDRQTKYNFTYPISKVNITVPNSSLSQEELEKDFATLLYYHNFDFDPQEQTAIEKEAHYYIVPQKPHITQLPNGYQITFNIAIIPRIPTQVMEAISYFIIFLIIMWGYWKQDWYKREGLVFGVFFFLMFSARFIIEFWKEHQAEAMDNATLNMGQWLSIPGIIIGIIFIAYALRRPVK